MVGEKSYPPQKDVQFEKKNTFYTPFSMFEMRFKKVITLRNVPFSCKLYLYLFALFSLLYFVCTHSIKMLY